MPRRKPRQTEEYEILLLRVLGFHASVSGAINPQVRDRRYALDRMKVYDFHSSLDLQASCTFPENRADANYFLNLHGTDPSGRDFSTTLGDCRARDERGSAIYRKVRGESRPTYNVPEGIGSLRRLRGTSDWAGWVWVAPRTISDMLCLLPHIRPLFLQIHEHRIGRSHWILGITLQTEDPEAE